MRILFDNNVPAFLMSLFSEHDASTAALEGWHELSNGALLSTAEAAGFQILLTLDKGFTYQQSMRDRNLTILVLEPRGQKRDDMMEVGMSALLQLLDVAPGAVVTIRPA